MTRMSIIIPVLCFFDSRLRLTRRMDLKQHVLDSSSLVDDFHTQKMVKKNARKTGLVALKSKTSLKAQQKSRNFEIIVWT